MGSVAIHETKGVMRMNGDIMCLEDTIQAFVSCVKMPPNCVACPLYETECTKFIQPGKQTIIKSVDHYLRLCRVAIQEAERRQRNDF